MKTLEHNSIKYEILDIKPEKILSDITIDNLRTKYGCDIVFKRNGLLFVCNKLIDAEFVDIIK